ncbi:hypothetical protein CAC42_647 [Sphaceloma murrayae]|uniref:UBA domain-containing protein n=1 Tax=Sphaceloma murrayae TaxID=2082308 RepID=A0A2K1QJP6_9PEZI|nr:hypothetical protein CAC42_647 [Sphaceloma murrayae]
MVEPTAENIRTVVEVTQADPEIARRYLKVKDNDAAKAINALFEGEDITQAESALAWDEEPFNTDRDGNVYGPQGPPAYGDSHLRPLGASAAPTRGSSPVPSLQQPKSKAEEDDELEKALANSRQDLGYADQESGVISAGNRMQSSFGPATRTQYDPSQWAMIPTSATNVQETKEIIPDIEPSARKNEGQKPRFLKHTASGDYLPNLLTIAHSIPLARETLLLGTHTPTDYGHDPEWWRGHAIKSPRIVSTETGALIQPSLAEEKSLVEEMQRIVAVLDRSHRSYASTETLTKLAEDLSRSVEMVSDSALDRTLCGWEVAASAVSGKEQNSQVAITQLFHSIVGTNSNEGVRTPHMWSLPLSIPDRPPSGILTLADTMDQTLWDMDPNDEDFCDTYMERCAEILPMRVSEETPGQSKLNIEIPTFLYVDKYLQENIGPTRMIRKDMARAKKRITQLETLQHELVNVRHPDTNEQLGALDILKATRDYFSGASREAVLADNDGRGIDISKDALAPPAENQEAHDAMAAKLASLWDSITAKIELLEQEKLKAKEALSKLSQSSPPGLAQDKLKHRYTLRGVATKPNVTYVLRPRFLPTDATLAEPHPSSDAMQTSTTLPPSTTTAPKLDLTPNTDDPEAPPGYTWWRIELDISLSRSQIHKTESTTDDVLRAVQLEHSAALLVYASDRAVEWPLSTTLPERLEEFVRRDNEAFARELDGAAKEQTYGGTYWQDEGAEWNEYVPPPAARRGSAGSTMVNFDEGEEQGYDYPGAGEWEEKRGLLGEGYGSYGGLESKGWESPEAHEIRLDEEGEEMVEKERGSGMVEGRTPSVQMGGVEERMGEKGG